MGNLNQNIEDIHKITRKTLEIKVKNMKCQYDMKTSQKSYENGEKV